MTMELTLSQGAAHRVSGEPSAGRFVDCDPSLWMRPAETVTRPTRATEPTFDIVTDEAGFLALEPEWENLRAQLREPRFSQSFVWCRRGWETTGRPRGRDLFILVMRVEGRAVLIWPLAIRRKRGLWRVAAPLGPEWTDYDPGLVQDSTRAVAHVRAAWDFLRKNCPADLIHIPHCREREPLHEAIGSDPTARTVSTLPSPHVVLTQFPDWASYWKARSRKTKDNVGRRSRRFAELGEVSFGLVEDRDEFESLLEWTLARKRDWMDRTGLDNDFLRTAEFPDFLREMGAARSAHEGLVMFALKLDGRTVATRIGALDSFRYEGFLEAQDPEFTDYSPGSIILVESLKWCHQRGLDLDFRIGAEEYKRMWATGDRPATTYRLAIRRWGRVLLRLSTGHENARVAKDRVRVSIPAEIRRKVKQVVGGRLSAATGTKTLAKTSTSR